MHLDPDDLRLFYKLYPTLLCFVNQRLGIMGDSFTVPGRFGGLPPDQRIKLRDALVTHMDLIDTFVSENPFKLSGDELDRMHALIDRARGGGRRGAGA